MVIIFSRPNIFLKTRGWYVLGKKDHIGLSQIYLQEKNSLMVQAEFCSEVMRNTKLLSAKFPL